jgi:hypothetical protein
MIFRVGVRASIAASASATAASGKIQIEFGRSEFCGLVGIRTPNLLIRSEMLYPVELQNQYCLFKRSKDNQNIYMKKSKYQFLLTSRLLRY